MKLKYTYGYLWSKMYLEIILTGLWAVASAIILRWQFWYLYPVFCLLGILVYSLLFALSSKVWELLYYKRLTNEEKIDFLTSQIDKITSDFTCETDFMEEISEVVEEALRVERHIVKQAVENIEAMKNFEAKKEVLETPEVIQDIELASFYKENELFENAFHKFILIQPEKDLEANRALFQEIKSKINMVFDLIAERESLRGFVNKIFNIYMPEIVILINDLSTNKKPEYKQNILKVINELNTLLDKTVKAMKETKNRNAEITFDLLVKEMKREGDEIDGNR